MIEINLQKIKFWVIIAIIQIASFGLGYYSASSFGKTVQQVQQLQDNSNIKQANEPVKQDPVTTNATTSNCPIKGNISSKSKIYHVQGGAFYARTQEEMCFQTEAEAQAAGFTKSNR